MYSIVLVCASNNPRILAENLMLSPMIGSGAYRLEVIEDAPSATAAYNAGLDRTTADVVVFLHHDVYLPLGWDALLQQRIAEVEAMDPDWALLGAYGLGTNNHGYGPVWSSSIGKIAGEISPIPMPVQAFDELLFVMRRDAGLRFDEGLEGFHMYGTDIVSEARSRGLGAYSVSLPLIHNDGYKEELGGDFTRSFFYMRRKWASDLPIQTPIIRISWSARDFFRVRRRLRRSRTHRSSQAASNAQDPRDYARLCGWMDLRPNLLNVETDMNE